MSKSCWLITPWFKPIPGIKRYAMRLLCFKRVWVALFSSFFYGSFRQATFSPLQPQRDSHQNPAKSWKSGFFRFLKFKNMPIHCYCVRRSSNQYQGSKGMIWGFHPPKWFGMKKNSSFFCRDFRKITFFRLQSQRNFHQNPENHEKVDFSDFWNSKACKIMIVELSEGQTNIRDRKVWYEALIPQKGLGCNKFLIFYRDFRKSMFSNYSHKEISHQNLAKPWKNEFSRFF